MQGWSLTAGNTSAPTVICLVWSGSLRLNHRHGCSGFFFLVPYTIPQLPTIISHFSWLVIFSTRNLPMFLFQGQKNIILPFRIFPNVHHFSWITNLITPNIEHPINSPQQNVEIPYFFTMVSKGVFNSWYCFFFQSLPIVTMHDYYWLLTINEWLLIDNTSMVSNCQFQGIQSRRIHDHFAETSFFTQL